jgi:hypothetical protein
MADYPPQSDKGRGALFRIPEAERKSDKYPIYRGDISLPDGSKWKLSGWVRETKNGDKFLSLSAEPFEERQPQERREEPRKSYAEAKAGEPQRGGGTWPGKDDPIPFGACR